MAAAQIYEKYRIMPQLAEHQYKVAAVASFILENLTFVPVFSQREKEEVVAACLLHDMGNIIKFDLNATQSILNKKIDIEYWQKVKQEFVKKYGADEHEASVEISKEIGVSQRVLELVNAIGFLKAIPIAQGNDFGKKICQYGDDRIAPWGVVSLKERFLDLRERYGHHHSDTMERNDFENSLRTIEKQIFEKCKIKPEDITEEAIKSEIEKLINFEIVDK
jgi:hypothetical protein